MSVVIIPAYKPDETLVTLTDQLGAYGCQIVVVDDGSGQEYQQIFDKVRDVGTVLKHLENRGKGAAIKSALRYIKEEYRKDSRTLCSDAEVIQDSGPVGIMDCDGQHLPEDMRKLLETAGMHKKTLVLGVRDVGKEMPLKSRLGNQITRAVFRMVSDAKVSDTQTGLRAFDSEMIPDMLSVEGERYEYEMNVLITFVKAHIPIEEVPIHTIYRDKNNSNSHFRSFVDSVRIYRGILRFTVSSIYGFVLDYLLFFMPHTAYMFLDNIAARASLRAERIRNTHPGIQQYMPLRAERLRYEKKDFMDCG